MPVPRGTTRRGSHTCEEGARLSIGDRSVPEQSIAGKEPAARDTLMGRLSPALAPTILGGTMRYANGIIVAAAAASVSPAAPFAFVALPRSG